MQRARKRAIQKAAAQLDEVSTVANSLAIIIHGMGEVWEANDDTVAFLLEKARLLPRKEAGYLLTILRDYYNNADNSIKGRDFDRIEREQWPELEEEERLMPMIDFGLERATRLGIEQGIEKGRQQGIEQSRQDAATRMLAQGVPEAQVCKFLKLTKKELTALKRKLKN